MFYFLCRAILHRRNAYNIEARKASMVLSPYLRYMSSDTNQHSLTVSYLINKCGLSPESALSASKRVQFNTPDKPNLVLSILKNNGFSKVHISEMIRKCPETLCVNPERTILPKIEFFRCKGASTSEIVRIFTSYPWILRRSLENKLVPNFNYFRDLLLSDEKTISVIRRSPNILYWSLEANVISNINTLRENGVPEANIRCLIYCFPMKLEIHRGRFKELVDEVKEMGFSPLKSQFVVALMAPRGSKWDSRVNTYKRWGWSNEDVLTAFGKCPWCMTISEDKIMAVMDFYVNKLGLDSSVIVRRPVLLTLSLKKRLVPRVSVIHSLSSKGLIKIDSGIIKMFECTEKSFIEKCVNCHEEAPQLLKLYNEKLDLCQ